MKTLRLFIWVFALLIISSLSQKAYEKKLLHDNWVVNVNNCPKNVKLVSEIDQYLQTSVPTNLHLDLLKHGKIQDPFFSNNWQTQKWISQCNAFYKHTIQVSQQTMLQYQVINLVFEGIDTYSTIKLNSKQILQTENSFVKYKVNVKQILNVGLNVLEVEIVSTKPFDDKGQRQNQMPFPYAHTRKPCYQYSWDWAPYMNTLGIWKSVYLQMYDNISIDYVWIQLQKLSEHQAELLFAIKTNQEEQVKKDKKYQLRVFLGNKQMNRTIVEGEESYVGVRIDEPRLWWPNGIGQPYVYEFEVRLYDGNYLLNSKHITYGLRTVHLDQTSNKFTLIINGYRVYCKGANYVPLDMLYPRSSNSTKLASLFTDIVRSNFNMLRVWGGGQYESDQFYQMASKMGIMLFHDFMFSDSIYPSTEKFLNNVQVEVVQQVRRIRNYPALTLWAGNNEILQGIQSWGWGREKYKQDYKKLFEELIPSIIKTQCPYIPYIPSSPVKGIGNVGFEKGGDVHYWGVWAAALPFQNYQTAIGPFNSQFGTQSLPVWQTIQQFTTQNGRSYSSNQLSSHERHNSRFNTLRKYMGMYAKPAISFQMQVYQSGLVQAWGIEIAIKAQRQSKHANKSMGTLYWQLNDAWPAISWSAIDYYNRWKPLQYKARNLYQDVIAYYSHHSKKVIVISDKLYNINCLVQTKLITFDGQVLKHYNKSLTLRENEAQYVFELNAADQHILEVNGSWVVVYTKVVLAEEREVAVATFVKPFKDLELRSCELQVKFGFAHNQIYLAAKCLVKSLHIYHKEKYLALTDNYIDVIPGQIHKTTLLVEDLKSIASEIKFKSYFQSYDKDQLQVVIKT